ncbi:hypothetical protein D3C85_1573690 [compost metagenome]
MTDVTITARTAQEAVTTRCRHPSDGTIADRAEPARTIGVVTAIQWHAGTLIRVAEIQCSTCSARYFRLVVLGQLGSILTSTDRVVITAVALNHSREIGVSVDGFEPTSHTRQHC